MFGKPDDLWYCQTGVLYCVLRYWAHEAWITIKPRIQAGRTVIYRGHLLIN
jgi:hypothetical protein